MSRSPIERSSGLTMALPGVSDFAENHQFSIFMRVRYCAEIAPAGIANHIRSINFPQRPDSRSGRLPPDRVKRKRKSFWCSKVTFENIDF